MPTLPQVSLPGEVDKQTENVVHCSRLVYKYRQAHVYTCWVCLVKADGTVHLLEFYCGLLCKGLATDAKVCRRASSVMLSTTHERKRLEATCCTSAVKKNKESGTLDRKNIRTQTRLSLFFSFSFFRNTTVGQEQKRVEYFLNCRSDRRAAG